MAEENFSGFLVLIVLLLACGVFLTVFSSVTGNPTLVYFSDYDKTVSDGTLDFSVVIANQEKKPMNYILDVTVDNTLVYSAPVSLARNQNFNQKLSLPFSFDKFVPHKVTVSLRGREELSSFYTTPIRTSLVFVGKASFPKSDGLQIMTSAWKDTSEMYGSYATPFYIKKTGADGNYLQVFYNIQTIGPDNSIYVGKTFSPQESQFNYLKVTAFSETTVPDTFYIKLIQSDKKVFKQKIRISTSATDYSVLLSKFTSTKAGCESILKVNPSLLSSIELGFDDPQLKDAKTVTVYFTGLQLVK